MFKPVFYTHFSSPELTISEDMAAQLMIVAARGVVPSEAYRKGYGTATEVAIKKHLPYWLVNNKEGGIITPEDQIWASEVMSPRLANESCIKKMALIEPNDMYSRIILEDLMDRGRPMFPFEMQFFQEVRNAYAWFSDVAVVSF